MNPPKPKYPEPEKYIFTEGIDYSKTGRDSIWGPEEKETLELMEKTGIRGKWLNLAAGDGRYNLKLLEKADFVVASDADESALAKIWQNTPDKFKAKLQTKVFDIAGKFPFGDKTFDGVFCTGALHLFPKEILHQIFSEIDRILKPEGRIFIDFATDVKRVLPDGKLYCRWKEQDYKLKAAERFLKSLLKGYTIIQMMEAEVPEEEINSQEVVYKFSCRFILVVGDKR